MSSLPSYAQDLGDGIFAIDTGFHRPVFDAAYLMVENGRAAFIDSGTNFAVPRLLATLEALGLAREAVEYVIPTHVHLDHAGGVGLLMQNLPAATAIVHPRGARHMIDPRRWWPAPPPSTARKRWRAPTAASSACRRSACANRPTA